MPGAGSDPPATSPRGFDPSEAVGEGAVRVRVGTVLCDMDNPEMSMDQMQEDSEHHADARGSNDPAPTAVAGAEGAGEVGVPGPLPVTAEVDVDVAVNVGLELGLGE